jgi:energy-coupling factor transporter ATP-binding protein EcfA2
MLFLPTAEAPDAWGLGGTFVEEQEQASPTSVQEPTVRILIIGETESGKSTIMRSIVQQFTRPDRSVYVVNDRTLTSPYEKIGWEKVAKLEFATIIFEDIISCKKNEFVIIQEVLNFKAHHNHCNLVICIAHSLHKTGMFGLLPYFNFVYIAAKPSSLKSFKALLREYDFPPETRPSHVDRLKSVREKYSYLMLDVNESTFKVTSAREIGTKETLPESDLQRGKRGVDAPEASASKFLGHLPKSQDKLRLFDIIYPSLPPRKFNSKDLTVTLRSKKWGETRISLIDYISLLTDDQFAPTKDLLKLHKYLRVVKNICLPKTYASNRQLW